MSIYWCDKCKLYSTTETCPSCNKIIPMERPYYTIAFICKRCGKTFEKPYPCCGVDIVKVSDDDIVAYHNYRIKTEKEPDSRQKWFFYQKQIVLKYIQNEPEFDQDAFDKLYERYLQDSIELDKKRNAPPTPPPKPVVECPYCHSKNTSKISSLSKAVSIAAFGLFSQKRKYQWHCNNCRSDF